MNKKRIWSMLLSVCMLVSIILPVQAADSPKVTLNGSEVSADGTITLTAEIEGNPGISAYHLYFYYDTDVFEVAGLRAAGDFKEEGGLMTNSIANAKEKDRYDGQADKDGMLALWLSNTGTNTTGDGEMAILRLKLKDGAAPGSYDIGLGYSKLNTINEKGDSVLLTTQGVTYTVPGADNTTSGSGNGNGGGLLKPTQKPTFTEMEEEKPVFTDIGGNWAEDYILKAAQRGLVNGKSEGIFDPNANMTRAEFMTILWRAVGSPTPKGKATFTDIPMAWYQQPIAWAQENNITNGISATQFDPNGNVTREQMMTILWRMTGSPIGMETIYASIYDQKLADSASVSSWAKNAIHWSIFQEILSGEQSVKLGNTIAPKTAATRSQIAVSIIRYLDKY